MSKPPIIDPHGVEWTWLPEQQGYAASDGDVLLINDDDAAIASGKALLEHRETVAEFTTVFAAVEDAPRELGIYSDEATAREAAAAYSEHADVHFDAQRSTWIVTVPLVLPPSFPPVEDEDES